MYAFITRFGDHDVVVMAITNPQDVGCYTVTATGIHKALHGLLILERGQSPQCLFLLHTFELCKHNHANTGGKQYTFTMTTA